MCIYKIHEYIYIYVTFRYILKKIEKYFQRANQSRKSEISINIYKIPISNTGTVWRSCCSQSNYNVKSFS